MNPGDLLLDDRIAPQVMQDLAGRGHKIENAAAHEQLVLRPSSLR